MKDKCLMGEGIFLGESLLPLKNIQQSNRNSNIEIKVCACVSPMTLYGKDSIKKYISVCNILKLSIAQFPILGCATNTISTLSPWKEP